jgi:predicted nucleic acid-binding protein
VIAFFDASALIYLLEGEEPWAACLRRQLRDLAVAHPDLGAALSRLSWLECRIGPLRSGDSACLQRFDAFFARPDLLWVELSRQVVELATELRARHGLRTPDALQAASCLQLRGDVILLSGDPAFTRVPGLQVRLLR